jgi:hypothetical protein
MTILLSSIFGQRLLHYDASWIDVLLFRPQAPISLSIAPLAVLIATLLTGLLARNHEITAMRSWDQFSGSPSPAFAVGIA